MIDNLTKAIDDSRTFARTAYAGASRMKAIGDVMVSPSDNLGMFGGFQDYTKNRQNYNAFKNWLYAAVNALAMEGAGQPINMGRLADEAEAKKGGFVGSKSYITNRMSSSMRRKAANQEYEVILDHPLLRAFEQPNTFQGKWQFVYSFFCNLNLTGWSYIVHEFVKDKLVLYSLPTLWVRPDHTKGPYAEFRVVNPREPESAQAQKPLTRENVSFAYLPDPLNPLGAMAPATSQMPAIRIDNYIQAVQEQHFQKGIFPSVIVTVGKDPIDGVAGDGIRPRLTGAQRRQIYTAINRAMAGVANFGAPAIVDGMIESITRFSSTEPEIGWGKSEDKVRTRILSAFCVHPYILGEPVGVGGYAQVAKIEERFCKRVNTYLDMLSTIFTDIARSAADDDKLLVWLEECKAHDPGLAWQKTQFARTNGDISQNELRAEIGLGPDEDRNEAVISGTQPAQVAQVLGLMASGSLQPQQVEAFLVGMGLPNALAKKIAGKGAPKPPPEAGAPPEGAQPPKPVDAAEEEDDEEASPEEKLQKSVRMLLDVIKTPLTIDVGDVYEG